MERGGKRAGKNDLHSRIRREIGFMRKFGFSVDLCRPTFKSVGMTDRICVKLNADEKIKDVLFSRDEHAVYGKQSLNNMFIRGDIIFLKNGND